MQSQQCTIVPLLQEIVAILLCGLKGNVALPDVVDFVKVRIRNLTNLSWHDIYWSLCYLVCEMQTECGKNFKCVEDGANFTCDECKDGYILEDGECVGMKKAL